jgi:hypothetical protein
MPGAVPFGQPECVKRVCLARGPKVTGQLSIRAGPAGVTIPEGALKRYCVEDGVRPQYRFTLLYVSSRGGTVGGLRLLRAQIWAAGAFSL